MTNTTWQKLVQSALETEDFEIDCEECYSLLDMYADILLAEENPDQMMPTVKQHLKQCNCCAGELEALMVILEEVVSQENK